MTAAEPAPAAQRASLDPWRARYLAGLLVGRRRDALAILDEALVTGIAVQDLLLGVVQEAQREIGALWENNRISVAQEHMATAISQLALAHLYLRALPAPSLHKKVLLACVEGELHDFPARLAADVLELAGFDVCFLGANVPTDHLLTMIEAEQPDLLCLSVTIVHHLDALRTAVAGVRAAATARGHTLPIVVGGNAVRWTPGVVAEVGADGTGDDAVDLVRVARRLVRS